MKKKILSLIILTLCLCLCFALASCGEDDENKKGEGAGQSNGGEELAFDTVLNLFKDIEREENGQVDLYIFKGDKQSREFIQDFYSGILDDFDGEFKNSFYCGARYWDALVFECGAKEDAQSLEDWLDHNGRESTIYKAVGSLFIMTDSQYMLDVILGNVEYDTEKGNNPNQNSGSSQGTAAARSFQDIYNTLMEIDSNELELFEGNHDSELVLTDLLGWDILDDFDGDFIRSIYFEIDGRNCDHGAAVFECSAAADAEYLSQWLDKYNESDEIVYKAFGNLLLLASSDYMLDVLTGEKSFDFDELENSSNTESSVSRTAYQYYAQNLKDIPYSITYMEEETYDASHLFESVFGFCEGLHVKNGIICRVAHCYGMEACEIVIFEFLSESEVNSVIGWIYSSIDDDITIEKDRNILIVSDNFELLHEVFR